VVFGWAIFGLALAVVGATLALWGYLAAADDGELLFGA
jgi:hypothetical protein